MDDTISRRAAIDFVCSMEMCDEISAEAYKKLTNYLGELPSVEADAALRKAARKLAWIHQQIDLYDDRQELHEEDYWMDYLTDPEWIDPDIEWKGEE